MAEGGSGHREATEVPAKLERRLPVALVGPYAGLVIECRCGCGETVKPPNKAYVDNEHRLAHMVAGEASRMNRLQPREAKQQGGATAGREAADSGRLAEAGLKGAARAHEDAEQFRRRRS